MIYFLMFSELVNYDHFNVENLSFASYRSVTDAFTLLISIFEEKLPATKFEAIRLNCLHRAYRILHNEISRTANIHDLLKLLLSYPIYLNWMKIDYLQTMAIAARSQVLQDTLQSYSDAVLSKTLGEVWNFVPTFHKTKMKFYFKVKAKFRGKNPNHIKIKDLSTASVSAITVFNPISETKVLPSTFIHSNKMLPKVSILGGMNCHVVDLQDLA